MFCSDFGTQPILEGLAGPLNPEMPDYFGQAYTVLVQECFEELLAARDDRFAQLLPATFGGGLRALSRLNEESSTSELDARTRVVLLGGPILDILEISGYALLRGELGGVDAWDACKKVWDTYLTSMSDPSAAAEQIVTLFDLRDFPAILPGDITRTTRVMRFNAQLRTTLNVPDEFETLFEASPVHPSPIIQVATSFTFSFDEVASLFIVEYLRSRLPAAYELPRRVQQVSDALDRRRRDDAAGEED